MSKQLDRFSAKMRAIPVAVKEAVIPALSQSGGELQGRMRTLAPEDTGALKRSIAVTLPGQPTPPYSQPGGRRTAKDLEVIVTAGNAEVRYAHLAEYGHAKAQAHPFFWPAFRLSRKRITGRIKRAISKAVRTKWGSG